MKFPARRTWILAATATATAAAVGFAAAILVAQPGCGSECASDCPPATVYIGSLDNTQLYIDEILVSGPACPPQYGVSCLGDRLTTTCTHVTITGLAQGVCDVLFVFRDRPAMIVRTEFGPPIQHGCCKGYTVVSDSVFSIPGNPDAGITDSDGGTDAISIFVEAGAGDAMDGGVD